MNRSPILNMWATTLGKSIANPRIANGRNIGNFARTLTLFWALLWFAIRSYYEAVLFNNMKNTQVDSSFDTIEKIRASNCKILTIASAYALLSTVIEKER